VSKDLDVPADLYISGDIEADGPIPGPYSMLSFGLAVAGRFDGNGFEVRDPAKDTFYAELQPISTAFVTEALRVSHLDRERLKHFGRPPVEAMTEAASWVRRLAKNDRPVFVGFPAPFDWLFLYWYFVKFANGGSPFDFSAVLDMKTMFQQKALVVSSHAGKDDLPDELRPRRKHTHHARDDAIEQGELFARLFTWEGNRPATQP
jgi:hypothetical protein